MSEDVSDTGVDTDVDEDIFQKPESGSRISVRIVSTRSVNTLSLGYSSGQDTSATLHIT